VVDRDPVDRELEILSFVGVKTTQEDLFRVTRAPLVRQKEARCKLERVGCVRARDCFQLADRHLVVGRTVRPCLQTSAYLDGLSRLRGLRGWTTRWSHDRGLDRGGHRR